MLIEAVVWLCTVGRAMRWDHSSPLSTLMFGCETLCLDTALHYASGHTVISPI